MFSVGISLGFSSTYVAVAPLPISSSRFSAVLEKSSIPSINIVANTSGYRKTYPCCAFTDAGEILFGDTAHDYYVRNPEKVIPAIFAYAALENISPGCSNEYCAEKENFRSFIERSVSTKYKGHKEFVVKGSTLCPFHPESAGNNENTILSDLTATSLFIQYLNHLKEHSVDDSCRLKKGGESTKNIFLTVVAPRYAFPTFSTQGKEACDWVVKAVMQSEFKYVVSNVHFLFSDESSLLGTDLLLSTRRNSSFDYSPSLLPPKTAVQSRSQKIAEEPHNRCIIVVDWGAQGLNLTKFTIVDGMLAGHASHTPFFSTLYSPSSPSIGGDAMDVTLADRVALAFIQEKSRLFSSEIPQLSTVLRSQRDTVGKMNPIVVEHIPSRAMRRLRLLMEERKSSLLRNLQTPSVSVEVEAFYEGLDVLDTKTLSRNKVENAMEREWGLVENFSQALKNFLVIPQEALSSGNPSLLSDLSSYRVILCGGVCQSVSFTTALHNAIIAAFSSDTASRSVRATTDGIEIIPVSRLEGGVGSEEVFALGGCFHSYLAGMMKLNNDLARKSRIQKAFGPNTGPRLSRKEIEKSAFCAGWDAIWKGIECTSTRTSVPPLRVNFLQQNIYLFTNPDVSMLLSRDHCTCAIQLPRDSLTKVFSQGVSLPSRVVLKWPEDTASVVLFFFCCSPVREETIECVDASRSIDTDTNSDLLSCCALSPTGIPLRMPSLPSNRILYISITTMVECEKPLLQLQLIAKKQIPCNESAPDVIKSDDIAETTMLDSTRIFSSINIPLPLPASVQ